MTKLDFNKALKALKNINTFKVNRHDYELINNTVRINYENEIIKLGEYDLIFSGTLEQNHNESHSIDRIYLAIALLDSCGNDVLFRPKQLNEVKKQLSKKILENV
tara:strand:+ start:321 stop:635 length:315 start_codon:yes stop_codon:yes gene_type:complete